MLNLSYVPGCCLILLCCILQLTGFFTTRWAYNDICPEIGLYYLRCGHNGTFNTYYGGNALYTVTFCLETAATIGILIGFCGVCFGCCKGNSRTVMKGMGAVSSGGACSLAGCIPVFVFYSEFHFGYSFYLCLAVGPITAGTWIIYHWTRRRTSEPSTGSGPEQVSNIA